jgi:hypothetical protein
MGEQDIKGQGNPEGNPNPNPAPAEDEMTKLRRENEELRNKNSQKDQYITNINNEKVSLETRLSQVSQPNTNPIMQSDNIQSEADSILEKAQYDPKGASHDLTNLIKATTDKVQKDILTNLQPMITNLTYVEKIKSENADLMELGLEPQITARVTQLQQLGKTFQNAVTEAVKESREKVQKIKSDAPIQPSPQGARAEDGSNAEPTPPPAEKEISPQEELNLRQAAQFSKGL